MNALIMTCDTLVTLDKILFNSNKAKIKKNNNNGNYTARGKNGFIETKFINNKLINKFRILKIENSKDIFFGNKNG